MLKSDDWGLKHDSGYLLLFFSLRICRYYEAFFEFQELTSEDQIEPFLDSYRGLALGKICSSFREHLVVSCAHPSPTLAKNLNAKVHPVTAEPLPLPVPGSLLPHPTCPRVDHPEITDLRNSCR